MVLPVGYIDGNIDTLDAIKIPITDRGFLYGDSVYEVFRTYQGVPFMFEEHLDRMENSARLSRMSMTLSRQQIVDALQQTVAASEPQPGEDVYVRYQLTRGGGAVDLIPSPDLESRLVIMVKPLPGWKQEHYDPGMRLAVTRLHRNPVNSLDPNIKGGNYLNNILAVMEAREAGADDCIMLTHNGLVTESSNSNVWFVIDDVIVTARSGVLHGLTRRGLMPIFKRQKIKAIERDITAQELKHSAECFITSATREVMPVHQLRLADGNWLKFAAGGGEKTRIAMELYREMIAQFVQENRSLAWF